MYSTGGTYTYIHDDLGIPVKTIEGLTGYPSILGGRVKTLHPSVFGGILARKNNDADLEQLEQYQIPFFDMVVVDLYPFEDTLASGADQAKVIENIDIGGISLIRAAAKNYQDVTVVPAVSYFEKVEMLLEAGDGSICLADRKQLAAEAFGISSNYDAAIANYLNDDEELVAFKRDIRQSTALRYGENPHQQACFYGSLDGHFEQLNGKALSYNNLLDLDAAITLIQDFTEPCFAIIKHTNVCGLAVRDNLLDAWQAALDGDPVSAFGGILITNRTVTSDLAEEIGRLFFEVLIAPAYEVEGLHNLKKKKNRIILKMQDIEPEKEGFRSVLNGVLWQTTDEGSVPANEWKYVTTARPEDHEAADLLFANMAVRHLKSNAIALAKDKQLIGIGAGQTSRVDALKQAIAKAKAFGHDIRGAAMASDAFFPFADSVQIAHEAGISSVIQPGGSVKDQESVDYCNQVGMPMVFTGRRHFKH